MIGLHTLHRRAARVLPAALQTSEVLLPPLSQRELVALALPLRHRHSGAIGFRLSPATALAMRESSRAWFGMATRAREGIGRRAEALVYRPWRSLRLVLPESAMPQAGDAPSDMRQDEPVEVHVTHSVDGRARLLVIPSLRLAMYSWRDRQPSHRRRDRLR